MVTGIIRICAVLLLAGCTNKPEKVDDLALEDKFSFDAEHQQESENQSIDTNNRVSVKRAAKQLARRRNVKRVASSITPSAKPANNKIKYNHSTLELVSPGEVKAPFEASLEYVGDSRDVTQAGSKEVVLVPKEPKLSHLKFTISGVTDVENLPTKEVRKGQKVATMGQNNATVKVESTNGTIPDLNSLAVEF